MSKIITDIRARYAASICETAGVTSPDILRAFSEVPRERFLGPGPWQMKNVEGDYQTTPDDNPVNLYSDLLVAVDPERNLNNGVPSFLARIMQLVNPARDDCVLHIGAGVGYYSAILAELVGRLGHVRAVEIDAELCSRARDNLRSWSNVNVENSDASNIPIDCYDVIILNAGTTHLQLKWLFGLRNGGRLIIPLTCSTWERGRLLLIHNLSKVFKAKNVGTVVIYPCVGSRDDIHAERLKETAVEKGWEFEGIVRFDPQNADESCWLKDDDYWLSRTQG